MNIRRIDSQRIGAIKKDKEEGSAKKRTIEKVKKMLPEAAEAFKQL